MNTRQLVQSYIDSNPVVVFSKSYCGYCMKVKRTLRTHLRGVRITLWNIDRERNGNYIQTELMRRTGRKTVPQVFINQKFIGGSDDIDRLIRKGELQVPQQQSTRDDYTQHRSRR